ncbi:SDR family NAD(P)-dependent oxidoreductase [Shouchella shacheensis]|uniref:SDR family NAD(P)-dependent oxidoreductase n=1 Tax=Shouchella shacheensis TaxID=1649580 RepID=UPI0007404153|nr:SDR family NAD(P)-dependent oxidoreductase [Shouchella shacheensis]
MKALVLGASGGMGYSIVNELSRRGVEVTAFARSKDKLDKMFRESPNVTVHSGDIFRQDELDVAASGVDMIFHAANIPYGDWQANLPIMTHHIIASAKKHSAKLAVVDNLYAYGRGTGAKIEETTPKHPHTKKGKIRLQMEEMIQQSGVPYVIAHFPDFYGPYAENAQLNYTLRQVLADKKANFIGNQSMAREHIYTPDGAKALVELALCEDAYGQNWNIPAFDVIKGEEVIEMVRSITGYTKGVSTVTKNMLRCLGFFNKQMREFVEMQYLNEEPVLLSGEKYEKLLGPVPRTPYFQGLRETIETYKKK